MEKKLLKEAFDAGRNFQGDFERNGTGLYPDFEAWHKSKAENLPISGVTHSKPDLESVEFFNLMQQYRMAPMTDQEHTIECFDKVKEWIRANCG